MYRTQCFARIWVILILVGLAVFSGEARGQIPGITGSQKESPGAKSESPAEEKPQAAPTRENPSATVATSSGPIAVREDVSDSAIQQTLETLLSKYPRVRQAKVTVDDGVVTLEGQVQDKDVHDDVTEFVRRVQGVRLVLNRMKPDAEVLTAPEFAMRVLEGFSDYVARTWLVFLIAVSVVAVSAMLAKFFGRYSEFLLAPFFENVLLRSVVGSLLSSLLLVGGLILALSILNLTRAVLSILGLASVFGLAVGFAFKDITENFIASVLLGVRRPFRIGDYISVAGQSGVVRSLNTRATVLVTLEGKQVRIPNGIIFKEILVNSSASSSARFSFDILIPYEVSADEAITAVMGALRAQEGIVSDPPPRTLVAALEPGGVLLRAFYWAPTQGIDGEKLASDVKLKVKVALLHSGITPPPTNIVSLSIVGRLPVEVARVSTQELPEEPARPTVIVTQEQAEANLHRDSRAAASATIDTGSATPLQHAQTSGDTQVSDEGENLLKEHSHNGDQESP
jgi:small conductance mechanosensitive channel